MKNFLKIWVSRLVVIAILLYCGKTWGVPMYKKYFTHEPEKAFIPTAPAQQGEFTVSFHEMGTLDAEKSTPVITPVQGKIIWLVQAGILVKKGDRIAELDVTDLKNQLNSSKLQYESSISDIGRAKEGIRMYEKQRRNDLDKAKADFGFATEQVELFKTQLAKKRDLAKEKLIPTDEILQAEMDAKSKEMDLTKRKMDLDLLDEQVKSDIKLKGRDVQEAEMKVKARKEDLDRITKQIGQAKIMAPADGLVVLPEIWTESGRRLMREGDQLYPNQSISTLPDLSHMLVKVKLGESDAPRVTLGMETLIRMDSIPNKVFHGTIKTIDSLAKSDDRFGIGGGQKKIDVVVAMKESDPKLLKPGLTTDVEFVSKRLKNAIYVPLESIIERDGKTSLFVNNKGRYKSVVVKTGLANDNSVCIAKGIKKGQVIALRDPTRSLEDLDIAPTDSSDTKKKNDSAPIPERTK